MQDLEKLIVGSDHPYTCKCDVCLRWWVQVGPEDTGDGWSFGPFTKEEYVEAGGVLPIENEEVEIECACGEGCGTVLVLTKGRLYTDEGNGYIASIDLPQWLEDAIREAYKKHSEEEISDTLKTRGVFESALVALCAAWDVYDETGAASNRELNAREVLKNMCVGMFYPHHDQC